MPHLEIKRHMGRADIDAVTELLEVAAEADRHHPLGEHTWLDLVQGGREGFAGLVAWEPGHGHPVGYAQLSREADGTGTWALEFVVDPHHRDRNPEIGLQLVSAALDVVAGEGGGHVHLWVPKPTALHDHIAEAAGLRPGRQLFQMRRPLPIAERADLATRPFEPGQDEDAWLTVNNRAFRWHQEQGGWDLATIRQRERQDWFDPAGFLLHERDGRLAGFCWTKVHRPQDADHAGRAGRSGHAGRAGRSGHAGRAGRSGHAGRAGRSGHAPPVGEIYVVAVDPDFQGLGLGRRLVVAGLDWLGRQGLTAAMLYVDRDNVAAVRMYESMGFVLDHVDQAYVGDVAERRSG